jgi:hypothetical protein
MESSCLELKQFIATARSTDRAAGATTAVARCGRRTQAASQRRCASRRAKPTFSDAPLNTLLLRKKVARRVAQTSSPRVTIATANGIERNNR